MKPYCCNILAAAIASNQMECLWMGVEVQYHFKFPHTLSLLSFAITHKFGEQASSAIIIFPYSTQCLAIESHFKHPTHPALLSHISS